MMNLEGEQMIFFNPEITVKKNSGIFDFTCDIPEYNQITIPVLYNENDNQKICVGMEKAYNYFDTPYFPVRLQCFYDEGKRYFYTTGYISQSKIFLPNSTLEVITDYFLPLIDIEPLDKNEYGNNLKSKLAMYGYNVRKGVLSKEQRHTIIDFVIKHRFMPHVDVINLLEHHMSYIHNWYAQNKWEEDVCYVKDKYMKTRKKNNAKRSRERCNSAMIRKG